MMNGKEYFSPVELRCHCGKCDSEGKEMNEEFMKKLIALRERLDFPFVISSAYRCLSYNARISQAKNSAHTTGRAVDIVVRGEKALQVVKEAIALGFTGIGVKQKDIGRFIHLDDLQAPDYPRPSIWSY
jgi:zinc D-Ala-D-Ala carboxypeptidase